MSDNYEIGGTRYYDRESDVVIETGCTTLEGLGINPAAVLSGYKQTVEERIAATIGGGGPREITKFGRQTKDGVLEVLFFHNKGGGCVRSKWYFVGKDKDGQWRETGAEYLEGGS